MELLKRFTNFIPKNSILIPIPLHWSRFIWRGYNQAKTIAQSMQKIRPDLIICTDLKRIKKTKQQANLNKNERIKNMKEVFQWKGILSKESSIFLIDDVFTSGSTMHAAKKTLEKNTLTNIKAIVFARTK